MDGETKRVVSRSCRRASLAAFSIIPLLTATAAGARAQSTTAPIRATLPSGVHLIVAERPGAPLTAIEVRVRVGSAMETPATNGLAHLIEHLVFKGADDAKPGDIDTAIAALGGQLSARTSRDSTRFSTVVPSEKWQATLRIIIAMLIHPAFRPDDMAAEKAVIRSEMAQLDSTTERWVYNDLATQAFAPTDSDRLLIMGDSGTLEHTTPNDVRAFWKTWYRPENITVVVAGTATGDDAAQLIDSLFPKSTVNASTAAPKTVSGAIPNASLHGVVRVEPASRHEDSVLTTVTLAFPGPAATDFAELPAIESIIPLLVGAGSNGGWLGQRLMTGPAHPALKVGADYLPGTRSGLFFLSATGMPESGAPALERALVAALRRLSDDSVVDDDMIASARDIAANDVVAEDATVAGLARRLADGDARSLPPEFVDSYANRVRAISPSEIRHVISRYLTPDQYLIEVNSSGSRPLAHSQEQP